MYTVNERTTTSPFVKLLLGVAVLFLIFPFTLVQAFVLVKLWGWFIVPHFGLPPLGMAVAVGITLIAGLFAVLPRGESTPEETVKRLFTYLFGYLMLLVVGYIFSFFV